MSSKAEDLRPKRPASARRRKRSAGNVMLESVFTLLPTFALIIAFVDFSLMLFRWSTIQNAVREGCRYAVTYQTQSGVGQVASIQNVVQQYAMGFVKTTDSPAHIFVNFYDKNTLTASTNLPGNVVEVSIQNLSFSWLAPLSGSFGGSIPAFRYNTPLNLSVYAQDMLGGYPVGVTAVTP